ncbi:hypothetical protein AKJ16_DCAP00008 [Drosera capensis]
MLPSMASPMVVRLRLRRCSWPDTMTVDDDHCLITEPVFPSPYNMSLGFPLLPHYASEPVSSLDSLCREQGLGLDSLLLERLLIIIQGAGNAIYSCSKQLLERLLHYEMPPSTNPLGEGLSTELLRLALLIVAVGKCCSTEFSFVHVALALFVYSLSVLFLV